MNTKTPKVYTKGFKRASSLRMPALCLIFDDPDLEAVLRRVEELIILQVWMADGVDEWKPLLDPEKVTKPEEESGLLAFWIDASNEIPQKEPDRGRIERFDRGISFLKRLISVDRHNDELDRDRALQKLMGYAFQWLYASLQITPERWQEFLRVGSHRPKACAKVILDQAATIHVRDAFWLMENLYEADAGFVDSEKHPGMVQAKLLIAKHLWHIISHSDQHYATDYMRRARLLKGPVLFISATERKTLAKSEEEFRRIHNEDVYDACNVAVDKVVAAAEAFNRIDFECLLDQTKGMHGKWGTYLQYAGMKCDPLTFRITEVAFLIDGRNQQFGGMDIDVRIRRVYGDLEKAGEHIRSLLLKAGMGLSINGSILLRSSATFPSDFGNPEERVNGVDRTVKFEFILK